jgi:hypothetical protein
VTDVRTDEIAVHWLGDDTQDGDVWELRNHRDRYMIFGRPTTLYFKMDDGTQILVPSGWWIYDVRGSPYISSASPSPSGNPGKEPRHDP